MTSDTSSLLSSTSRRRVLKAGGAGLLATSGWLSVRPSRAQAPVELNFAFGPDDSGSLAELIDAFNAEQDGRIKVIWREMARASDDYHRQLVSDFEVRARDIDVFGADIVWTAEFASQGWCQDLSDRFSDDFSSDDFLSTPLRSARFRGNVHGVPWFTDAGMLFYRRDLLESSGFSEPPASWEELANMATQVRDESGVKHGFVFQGAAYEGGVTNALEFIWNAGGRVLTGNVSVNGAFGMAAIDPNVITVNSRNSAAGLDIARRLVADGIVPDNVFEFQELQAQETFLAGDAVFMRNWPYSYGLLKQEGVKLKADQIGIAALPVRDGRQRSYSCLGGWNLMTSAYSDKQEAAWEFIRFACAPEQQKARAKNGGFLPTLAELYEDDALLGEVPIMELGAKAIENSRVRPESPYYTDMSPRIAGAWNRVLRGELDGSEAVERLQTELERILRFKR